ncbi:hypothetical protein GCM10010977_22010 [Citricoccus zhacaiensis]|uniref:DUF262 domain-containing protein n=1 Tax=Citricoccus zhacaiensis TaxID=489142 RepID=A0ABQ2M3Q0_9MICC|nr:DUF262 domain-containing protein [Citricoccus zhacaiensis]GGO46624.1 hypothetical protein GCM10010977_22010 [Citricoccus zhacaiensis]
MVKASEISVQKLLEGSYSYQIPLYQRTYSWTRDQLERLWEDVVTLAEERSEDAKATHFIGSIVLAPGAGNGPGVHEYLVVDGQQRLTTLTLLLAAVRDHRRDHEAPQHFDRINEKYLLNKWESGVHRYKLLPTQADRASYQACIDATPHAGGTDGIGTAYRYFQSQLIAADDPDDPVDIERIEEAVTAGLALVSVTTSVEDNTYRIFESLNNTGLQLTQGDLLRNYIFMRLPTQGETVYQSLWLPLQNQLESRDLELLFWLDLVQKDPSVKQTDTYEAQKRRMERLKTEDDIRQDVERLARLGGLLSVILKPNTEHDASVRTRLQRLRAWGTTTVYPILLFLLDQRAQGAASSETIAQAMLYLESFLVRRVLAGQATTGINRILLGAVVEIQKAEDVAAGLHRYLSTGRKYFLRDDRLVSALQTIPFYLNGRSNQRKLILQWLEESFENKEPVDLTTLTIEHVMPRTLTQEWRNDLARDLTADETAEEIHEALLHTLGNLTLTGYNSSLSNSPFAVKRAQLTQSGLRMNQSIAKHQTWGRPEILARAESLAQRIAQIWPAPVDVAETTPFAPGWMLMEQAVAALPPGGWTTYGDLAALIGSHPVPVGQRVATRPLKNGHRVLQAAGTISPGFRWYETDRTDDPIQVLSEEGVQFDDQNRADPAQRLDVDDLARLVGADLEESTEPLAVPDGGTPERRDSFLNQLTDNGADVTQAVLRVINEWSGLGGAVRYGSAAMTSCYLEYPMADGQPMAPVIIYPNAHFEVVFMYLQGHEPFQDPALLEELRVRINQIPGVDIPGNQPLKRPNIRLETLVHKGAVEALGDALRWFYDTMNICEKKAPELQKS